MTILFVLVVLSISLFSQQNLGDGWQLSGQIQLRTELDGRDFSNSTHPFYYTNMRTRLGVQKSFSESSLLGEERINFFVQLQDSRVFGEEPNTLATIDNIDLHQGYVELDKLFGWDWSIQGGRFEMVYGTERFFGAVGWNYVGRSFDGVRFRIMPECWNVDLFGLTIHESVDYIGNATPLVYPNPAELSRFYSVYGIYNNIYLDNNNSIDLLGYYEANHQRTAGGAKIADMFTIAASHYGNYGKIKTTVEVAYQFGKYIETRNISAYLISLFIKYNSGPSEIGIGCDILSGSAPDSPEIKTSYEATFGTNHKFYGYMDYFINIPRNTNFLGLHDFYLIGNYSPENSKWNFDAKFHHFMSNKSSIDDENTFGQELDLTMIYDFIKGTKLTWGGSLFFPGDLMNYMFDPREDIAYWTYLMVTANL